MLMLAADTQVGPYRMYASVLSVTCTVAGTRNRAAIWSGLGGGLDADECEQLCRGILPADE